MTQPSYREEEPTSEVSNASLPSRQRHWMVTRLRTRMHAGSSRLHYQQFDYSSTDSDNEHSDVLLSSAQSNHNEDALLAPPTDNPEPIAEMPLSPLPAMEALFSDNEVVPDSEQSLSNCPTRVLIDSADTSLAGTSPRY